MTLQKAPQMQQNVCRDTASEDEDEPQLLAAGRGWGIVALEPPERLGSPPELASCWAGGLCPGQLPDRASCLLWGPLCLISHQEKAFGV